MNNKDNKRNKEEPKTLTRAHVVSAITDVFDVTKHEASDLVEDVLNTISSTLTDGKSVKLAGFGTFSVRNKKERIGRNPKTMEKAIISSRKAVSFKPSVLLKKAINE
jgi:integration host factor subunit alpha